jgi:hypothetical protein
MCDNHHGRLLAILSVLDQLQSGAESIMAQPVLPDVAARAEELRETIIEMQAVVEEKLAQLSDG